VGDYSLIFLPILTFISIQEPAESQASKLASSAALSSSPLLERDGDLEAWPVPPIHRESGHWQIPQIWKRPDSTDALTLSSPVMLGPPLVPVESGRRRPVPLELTHLQRSIRRMHAASSKILLERLQEEWLHVTDASMYRELELEKQLWLLISLLHLRRQGEPIQTGDIYSDEVHEGQPSNTMLSLYENHGMFSKLRSAQ